MIKKSLAYFQRLAGIGLSVFMMVGCSSDETLTKNFKLTVNITWTTTTHTALSGGGTFSTGVGALHKADDFRLWSVGSIATSGLRTLAENSQTANLIAEIDTAITKEFANLKFTSGSISTFPLSVSVSFQANKNFPCLSFASRLEQSPDWFIGLNCLKLYENDTWIVSKTVDITPYDAGTDSGAGFGVANAPLTTQTNIAVSTNAALKDSGGKYSIGTFLIQAQ